MEEILIINILLEKAYRHYTMRREENKITNNIGKQMTFKQMEKWLGQGRNEANQETGLPGWAVLD